MLWALPGVKLSLKLALQAAPPMGPTMELLSHPPPLVLLALCRLFLKRRLWVSVIVDVFEVFVVPIRSGNDRFGQSNLNYLKTIPMTSNLLFPEMEVKGSTRGGRVLSLDGGGIRGLVLIMNLLHLEEALGRPLIHCFDWIAATSTGGMLGLAIASG